MSEESEYNDDSSQSYDSDISPQNISRPISSESKNDEFSDEGIIGKTIKGKMKNSEIFRTF